MPDTLTNDYTNSLQLVVHFKCACRKTHLKLNLLHVKLGFEVPDKKLTYFKLFIKL